MLCKSTEQKKYLDQISPVLALYVYQSEAKFIKQIF